MKCAVLLALVVLASGYLGEKTNAADSSQWVEISGGIETTNGQILVVILNDAETKGAGSPTFEIRTSGEDREERFHLSIEQSAALMQELEELSLFHSIADSCASESYCVLGVARCRPSRNEPQLMCPGIYSVRAGESGLILNIRGSEFRYPHVLPEDLHRVLDRAIKHAVDAISTQEKP